MSSLGCLRDGSGDGEKNPEQCPIGGKGEGNPSNPLTGNKFQLERDYSGGRLSFSRYFNGRKNIPQFGLGHKWTHSFASRLFIDAHTTYVPTISAFRARGRTFYFVDSGGQWETDADVPWRLT